MDELDAACEYQERANQAGVAAVRAPARMRLCDLCNERVDESTLRTIGRQQCCPACVTDLEIR